MEYVPLISVPTKNRYDIYKDGKFDFSTFDRVAAQIEIEMGWGNVEVKLIKVSA